MQCDNEAAMITPFSLRHIFTDDQGEESQMGVGLSGVQRLMQVVLRRREDCLEALSIDIG
jgi:hypothetical protein